MTALAFCGACLAPAVSGLRIRCAAFSAIIRVGEQVLPEVMLGMIAEKAAHLILSPETAGARQAPQNARAVTPGTYSI